MSRSVKKHCGGKITTARSDGGSYLMETEQNIRDMLCKLYRNAEKEVLEYKSERGWLCVA